MAYLAGLASTPAAFLAVWAGLAWWRRLRRSEGQPAPEPHLRVYPVGYVPPPPVPSQEGSPVASRVRYGVNVPGRRNVRGRRPGR